MKAAGEANAEELRMAKGYVADAEAAVAGLEEQQAAKRRRAASLSASAEEKQEDDQNEELASDADELSIPVVEEASQLHFEAPLLSDPAVSSRAAHVAAQQDGGGSEKFPKEALKPPLGCKGALASFAASSPIQIQPNVPGAAASASLGGPPLESGTALSVAAAQIRPALQVRGVQLPRGARGSGAVGNSGAATAQHFSMLRNPGWAVFRPQVAGAPQVTQYRPTGLGYSCLGTQPATYPLTGGPKYSQLALYQLALRQHALQQAAIAAACQPRPSAQSFQPRPGDRLKQDKSSESCLNRKLS